jgi:hypothetical protein
MSSIKQIHDQAMDLAEEAFVARRKGEEEEATKFFSEALELEKQAASYFLPEKESEPTRSILYRSAATLAYHAKDYEQAEQLVAQGLIGYPPDEIKQELKALQDDINFSLHISLKGTQLAPNQMQMILWGNATGFGRIAADLLVKRIEQIKTIFYRTVERLLGLPYRTFGGPPKQVVDSYDLYLEAGFIPSSFGVSFSIGEPTEQLLLPGFADFISEKIATETIINEVLTCFELLQKDELDALKERFPNEDYLENFVGVVRQMAPDGNEIKALGLSSTFEGKERTVGLRRLRKEIPTPKKVTGEMVSNEHEERKSENLKGVLKLADSIKVEGKNGVVKLYNDRENKTYAIRVPLTQMQDVVQPFFEEYVVIKAYKVGQKYYFEDIEKAEKPTVGSEDSEEAPLNKDNKDLDKLSPRLL